MSGQPSEIIWPSRHYSKNGSPYPCCETVDVSGARACGEACSSMVVMMGTYNRMGIVRDGRPVYQHWRNNNPRYQHWSKLYLYYWAGMWHPHCHSGPRDTIGWRIGPDYSKRPTPKSVNRDMCPVGSPQEPAGNQPIPRGWLVCSSTGTHLAVVDNTLCDFQTFVDGAMVWGKARFKGPRPRAPGLRPRVHAGGARAGRARPSENAFRGSIANWHSCATTKTSTFCWRGIERAELYRARSRRRCCSLPHDSVLRSRVCVRARAAAAWHCFEEQIDYSKNDLTKVAASSASECQRRCQAAAKCQYFTFNSATSTCYLKTSAAGKKQHSAAVSGPKRCGTCLTFWAEILAFEGFAGTAPSPHSTSPSSSAASPREADTSPCGHVTCTGARGEEDGTAAQQIFLKGFC